MINLQKDNNISFTSDNKLLWGGMAISLFLPPAWALAYLILLLYKNKIGTKIIAGLGLCFFASLILIYISPIWDVISHYETWKYISVFDLRPDEQKILFGSDWYLWLMVIFYNCLDVENYIYFVGVVYFVILFSLYLFARKQAGEDCIKCWLALAAVAGFFPLADYTRNSLAMIFVLMPLLSSKYTFWFSLLCFWIAYCFHDAVVILLPSLVLFLLLKHKILRINVLTYMLLFGCVMVIFFIFSSEIASSATAEMVIGQERMRGYMESKNTFEYGADYIFITLSCAWIIFMLVMILKNSKEITNHYLLALFTLSSSIYFAAFAGGLYTVRIRFEYITLWTGMLLAYPVFKDHFFQNKSRVLNIALVFSFVGYVILLLKPSFYAVGDYFSNAELCRSIVLRILYYPTMMLLDVDKYGFGNSMFETAIYGGII